MQIISPRLHAALDYLVAATLIAFPIVFDFAAESTAALVVAVAGGIGLALYSPLTDHESRGRRPIPFRVHLLLDTLAGLVLLASPFVFGFGGFARGFYVAMAIGVLVAVPLTQREPQRGRALRRSRVAPHHVATGMLTLALMAVGLAGSSGRAEPAAEWMPQWTQNGELVLPENYHEWVFLGSPLTPHALNGNAAPFPEYHNVYIHPQVYALYKQTGEWPEGTIMLKELQLLLPKKFDDGSSLEVSGRGYFPAALNGIDISVKDGGRFAETNGWGFFNFGHHAPPYAETAPAQPSVNCAGCHAANAEDMVFMKFYRPVLEAR